MTRGVAVQSDAFANEVEALLTECEVRKEDSDIDPWWQIIHPPTGKWVGGPPKNLFHPHLRRTVYFNPRRFRLKREASEALDTLKQWAEDGPEEFFRRYAGNHGDDS